MEMSGQLHAPAALHRREKNPLYPPNTLLGGPQNRWGHFGEKSLSPCRQSKRGSSVVQAVDQSLYRLRYPGSQCFVELDFKTRETSWLIRGLHNDPVSLSSAEQQVTVNRSTISRCCKARVVSRSPLDCPTLQHPTWHTKQSATVHAGNLNTECRKTRWRLQITVM
jgi:hypothetical protein